MLGFELFSKGSACSQLEGAIHFYQVEHLLFLGISAAISAIVFKPTPTSSEVEGKLREVPMTLAFFSLAIFIFNIGARV